MDFFSLARSALSEYLEEEFSRKAEETAETSLRDLNVFLRLKDYVLGGKMIRGGLVMLASSMYGGSDTDAALKAGAALELLQSSFLIHDDIMDRDAVRRGKPSLHVQYAQTGSRGQTEDSRHLGTSLAICAGDISIFLAYEVLASCRCPPAALSRIHALISRELVLVGLAQMEDVFLGAGGEDQQESTVSADAVMNLYLYKTGRYSFSLPLLCGALLAGAAEEELQLLEKTGEQLGTIFQIKDDELGLFGTEQRIGKPPGSDLKENKQTLYRCFLEAAADSGQRKRLDAIFGNRNIDVDDVRYVQTLVRDLGVTEQLEKILLKAADQVRELIGRLRISDTHRGVLEELLRYNLRRQF